MLCTGTASAPVSTSSGGSVDFAGCCALPASGDELELTAFAPTEFASVAGVEFTTCDRTGLAAATQTTNAKTTLRPLNKNPLYAFESKPPQATPALSHDPKPTTLPNPYERPINTLAFSSTDF